MIRKGLLLKIYDSACMQRWNDKIRPVELLELDKQAQKMVIAFMLGKFEEENRDFSWIKLIEGGLFEFLQRIILTDLKPQIFYKIKEDQSKYNELNKWVYDQLAPFISPLGSEFCEKFKSYFKNAVQSINKRILSASHFYATKWEFDIIERTNPKGYEIEDIKKRLETEQEKYYDLKGVQQLALYQKVKSFADLCGELRFQARWSHIHRVPKTSVLGHMLIVAILSYLFSLEITASPKRHYNNFFTGLFHDLPEVLTRDIISPVKKSIPGLETLIKEYEKKQMQEVVYNLIPSSWHGEMRMFTENEFSSIVTIESKRVEVTSDEINKNFNDDLFNPRDGQLIEAVDNLAAFIEAYLAVRNGLKVQDFEEAKTNIKHKYTGKIIAGINFGEVYADFE